MKRGMVWLLPLCTALVIVAAAVLPQRLSQARDREYFDQIHAEEAKDKLFSPADDLAERLELLARCQRKREADAGPIYMKENLLSVESVQADAEGQGYSLVAHSSDLEQRAMDALKALAEEIPPLQEVIPESMEGLTGERMTIYAEEENLIAPFLCLEWEAEPGWHVMMYLDETMEKVVTLVLLSPRLVQPEATAWDEDMFTDLPRQFLTYLGMTPGERRVGPEGSRLVTVEGAELRYIFFYLEDSGVLSILPDTPQEESSNAGFSGKGVRDMQEYLTVRRGKDTAVDYAFP